MVESMLGPAFAERFFRLLDPRGGPAPRLAALQARDGSFSQHPPHLHTDEFYEVYGLPWTATALNRHALQWEHIYDTIRPYQASAISLPP